MTPPRQVDQKEMEKRKPFSIIQINQIDYVFNILIPMFDNLKFKSKKYKDYLDFKLLTTLIYEGKHLIPEGKDLINNTVPQIEWIIIDYRRNGINNGLAPIAEEKIKEIMDKAPMIGIQKEEQE